MIYDPRVIGRTTGGDAVRLPLKMANRHGLVTGATGTGKTVTLQVLAEAFSLAGVPVFATDIKGDLAGIAEHPSPELEPKLRQRAELLKLHWTPDNFPVWPLDLFGEKGYQVRVRVMDMGPELMAKLLSLTPTQSGGMNVLFAYAQAKNVKLDSLDDLQALCAKLWGDETIHTEFGYVAPSTMGIIVRQLVTLKNQGGDKFFGKPTYDVTDLLGEREDGLGTISLLRADNLMESPNVYAAFVMWMLRRLYQVLPEVGDLDQPKLVFFFDEAHLLFKGASPALLDTVERTVRLIRSKGVGVYFVTQSPLDIPEAILAQLSNKVQHALRAFTPKDTRAVRVAADGFRANPAFDTFETLQSLEKGTALISFLSDDGSPQVVQKVIMAPPRAHIGMPQQIELEEPLEEPLTFPDAPRVPEGVVCQPEPSPEEKAHQDHLVSQVGLCVVSMLIGLVAGGYFF